MIGNEPCNKKYEDNYKVYTDLDEVRCDGDHLRLTPLSCGSKMELTGYLIPFSKPIRAIIKCPKCGVNSTVLATADKIISGFYKNIKIEVESI